MLKATTLDDEPPKAKRTKPKGRKVRQGPSRKPIEDAEGNHTALGVGWIDQLTIRAGDASHRDAGLWAFETINPNAMNGAKEHMAMTTADFVMIQ